MTRPLELGAVVNASITAFPALFSIINPLGNALIFARLSAGLRRWEVTALARLVAFYSLATLLFSIWGGRWVLGFFGVSINALRVAGGLVVSYHGWVMLEAPDAGQGRKEGTTVRDGGNGPAPDLRDQAFFPLSMPLTVGPGAISVSIALSAAPPAGVSVIGNDLGITLAAAAMAAIIAVSYASAERVMSKLGVTGTRIVSRFAALILLAIGVQILGAGVQGFLADIPFPRR